MSSQQGAVPAPPVKNIFEKRVLTISKILIFAAGTFDFSSVLAVFYFVTDVFAGPE